MRLKIRELWILLIFNVAIGLFMKGVELFFPTYLKENRLIDPMWASIAYTMVLAAGVPGQWVGGKAADLVGSKKVLIATSAGVVCSLLALTLVPIYMVGIVIFIVVYGLSFYAHQPALNALTGFLSPQNQRGAVYGVFFFHFLRNRVAFTSFSWVYGRHFWFRCRILFIDGFCVGCFNLIV